MMSFIIPLQHSSAGAKALVLFAYLYIGFLMFLLPVCVTWHTYMITAVTLMC